MKIRLGITSIIILLVSIPQAWAAHSSLFKLVIKNQAFLPSTLTIPAGRIVKILVINKDALPAEFESYDLSREKVIPGGTQLPVYVGPLTPGSYNFFNDFHPSSKGKLIVEPTHH